METTDVGELFTLYESVYTRASFLLAALEHSCAQQQAGVGGAKWLIIKLIY